MENNIKNTITLTKKEEKSLDDLFNQFSKVEPNFMRFNEFFMLCLDRQILSSRVSFSVLFDLFLDCIDEEETSSGKEKSLSKSQFNFLLVQLSRILFHGEKQKTNMERLFNEVLLMEKTVATKDDIETARIPVFDEYTKKILSEQAINTLCQYEDELKACYISYLSENYENEDNILSWKEISLQKRKISSHGIGRFLKEANLMPQKLSYENVEEIMMKMVPPINFKESEFYGRKTFIHICEKELDGKDQYSDGDPGLFFHEFQLTLCRIATEEKRPAKDEKTDMEKLLTIFFEGILQIRKNNQIEAHLSPQQNKKIHVQLKKYYREQLEAEEKLQKKNSTTQDDDLKDPMQLLAELQNKQIFDADPMQFDVQDIYNILNKDLPALPEKPKVQQENPAPYKMDKDEPKKQAKVILGDLPPVDEDKSKGEKKADKKASKKGDDDAPKYQFAGYPPPDPKLSYDYLEQQHNELTYGQKNLTNINRGTMSEIEVLPLLLQEILYPAKMPQEIRYLIESAINCYNKQNYVFALKHFDEAKLKWVKLDDHDILQDQNQLFFEYYKASIYSSAGRDDYALYYFMQCKVLSDKLPYTNPDRAMAYSGLGYVLFSMEEYKMALRSFLKAREIREKLLGCEHVDTACCFNNLGCCMYMLDRNQESLGYFSLANSIFDCELGPFHNRTLVSAQNIKKAGRGYFNNVPEFPTLWETYEEEDKGVKKSKEAPKKKKK